MNGPCSVRWCALTTQHSIHHSAVRKFRRGPVEWSISLWLIDGGTAPYLKVIYTGETERSDFDWPILLADAPDVASFAARRPDQQIAAAITETAHLAGDMSYV